MILAKAVKNGLIEKNYATADYIDFPKAVKHKIDVMNEEEIKKFYLTLININNICMKTALMISLLAGFRRGEVAGLRWDDIDFINNRITISRSIRHSSEQGLFVKDPKTISSNRTITISKILINQLKEYKEYQDKIKTEKGEQYNPLNYVFTNSVGDVIRLDIFEKWMLKAIEMAGISKHTLHSLRHTNITLQIAAGIPIVTVSSRAGHSKTSTTTDIYAYSLLEPDINAAIAVDEYFKKISE